MMNLEQFREILNECSFRDWEFILWENEGGGGYFLQVRVTSQCNEGGEAHTWTGRKWYVSSFMCKSEVVATAFLAIQVAMEHEIREQFKYQGQSIYMPHYDVDRLAALRANPDCFDTRKEN